MKIFFFAENCPQRKCVKFLACVCRSRATVFKQKLARASYERFHGYSSGVSVFRCFDVRFRFRFQFRTIHVRLSWGFIRKWRLFVAVRFKIQKCFFFFFCSYWGIDWLILTVYELNDIELKFFLKFWLSWSNNRNIITLHFRFKFSLKKSNRNEKTKLYNIYILKCKVIVSSTAFHKERVLKAKLNRWR